MDDCRIVGLQPWLPGFLGRSEWWTRPVRAERWAAFRIGLAAVLLVDIFGTYFPYLGDFFGPGSLAEPGTFQTHGLNWSVLRPFEHDPQVLRWAMLAWAAAACFLLIGLGSRVAAGVAWCLAVSFWNLNGLILNAGDAVRIAALFYLMLSPCGAAWAVDAWIARRPGPVCIPPWPLRLLFMQMTIIYFFNGVSKLATATWREGTVMHWVFGDLALTRWSYVQLPFPDWSIPLFTYTVLLWELGFPLLVYNPYTRVPALIMGVCFHLGIGLFMELGAFQLYMLSLYLPLLPWEKVADRWRAPKVADGVRQSTPLPS